MKQGRFTRLGNSVAAVLRWLLPERMRPIGYLTHLVRERTHGKVRVGPFAGMRYVDGSVGSAYLPKLLGLYERELVSTIEEVCASLPGLIVNIGAGEGYYAVGLALRNPQARVIAFESRPEGRRALLRMAQLNDVESRIEIRGWCEPTGLREVLESRRTCLRPFVLCDAEANEADLLEPQLVPGLCSTDILVESHEFIRHGITDALRQRFALTHQIQQIWQTTRSREDFPFKTLATSALPGSYLDWAVSEWRPERMCWLWMKTRE